MHKSVAFHGKERHMRLPRFLAAVVLLLSLPALAQQPILCAPPPPPHQGGPCGGGGGGGPGPINPPPCCTQQNILVGDPASIRMLQSTAEELPAALRPSAKYGGGGTYACLIACAREDLPGAGLAYLEMPLGSGQQHLFSSFLTLINPGALAVGGELPIIQVELALPEGATTHYTLGIVRQRIMPTERDRYGEPGSSVPLANSYHAVIERDGQLLGVLPLSVDLARQQQLPLTVSTDQSKGRLEFELSDQTLTLMLPTGSQLTSLRVGQLVAQPWLLPESRPSLWFFDLRLNRDGEDVAL